MITEAQKKAVEKYKRANYDKILVTVRKGYREKIKQAAAAAGLSVNAFIVSAIRDKMPEE